MKTRVDTRTEQLVATEKHKARRDANAFVRATQLLRMTSDDLATLTDAVVRLSRSAERLVQILEEVRAEDDHERNEA